MKNGMVSKKFSVILRTQEYKCLHTADSSVWCQLATIINEVDGILIFFYKKNFFDNILIFLPWWNFYGSIRNTTLPDMKCGHYSLKKRIAAEHLSNGKLKNPFPLQQWTMVPIQSFYTSGVSFFFCSKGTKMKSRDSYKGPDKPLNTRRTNKKFTKHGP